MKKFLPLFFIFTLILFTSCSKESKSSRDYANESINQINIDSNIESKYKAASVTLNGVSISSDDGCYNINVTNEKQELVVTGLVTGGIYISNSNKVTSYKGLTIVLNGAYIKSDDEATIWYSLQDKNVEIISSENTTNYILNTSETNDLGDAIYSENNIEMKLEKKSKLYSYTCLGHTIKADGDFKITGSGSLQLSSGHDAIHCHNFTTVNGETFTGSLYVENAHSQAIEASKSYGSGTLVITSGSFTINNAESVFKVDAEINISGATIKSTGIWADPIVNASSNTLIVNISDDASFTVNKTKYTSCEIEQK